jgi:hypothetical protein
MLQRYIAVLQWTQPLITQWFGKHVLRYRVLHLFFGGIALLIGGVFLVNTLSDQFLQSTYGKVTNVVDRLYNSWLVISYDPVQWVATNMSWPVVWSTEQVHAAVASERPALSWWSVSLPANILTIDPKATVEDFPSYDTMLLVTDTYLIAKSDHEMRIIPLIDSKAEVSTGVVITEDMLTGLFAQWNTWLQGHGADIRQTVGGVLALWGILLLPLLAIMLTMWLSVGMLLVTLVCRWVSKLWIRIPFRTLFTWLSLSYLPIYLILKVLAWTQILPSAPIIWYLAMVACLAIYIVRVEERSKQLPNTSNNIDLPN